MASEFSTVSMEVKGNRKCLLNSEVNDFQSEFSLTQTIHLIYVYRKIFRCLDLKNTSDASFFSLEATREQTVEKGGH